MLDILVDEHRAIEDLYGQLAEAVDDPELGRLTSVLAATLTRHLSAEEQYLFPTVAAVLPDGARRSRDEVSADQAMLHALRQLESGPAADLSGIGTVEVGLRRHIRDCEEDLFPALRAVLSDEELIRLGNRVEIAAEAAPTRPHPATPATPPWNKVVEPAVGMVDKLRDALTRRSTRP
jgi:hemerythrin-like domain-containing protein